jgi:hypothetical protein
LANLMRRPVRGELLRERLDALVATFDISTIAPDPLQLVLRYDDPRDQEIAGLIAAAFAYGRADIVVANVGGVLDRMQPSPFAYLSTFNRAGAKRKFAGFAHRFHKTGELVALLERIAIAIEKYGSLGELFRRSYRSEDADIGPSLARFVEALLCRCRPSGRHRPAERRPPHRIRTALPPACTCHLSRTERTRSRD